MPVPRQEDSGTDLYCTLTEGDSRNAWTDAYYAVQIKSDEKPLVFDQERSVKAFVQFPLPLFLCIVKKKEQRLWVYHTSPRFYVWAHPPYPAQLELLPGKPGAGVCTQWDDGRKFDLSAPILEFSVADTEDKDFRETAKTILKNWVEYDNQNLYRVQTGLLQFTMPADYVTNGTAIRGYATQGLTRADEKHLEEMMPRFMETLTWISRQLYQQADLIGALRACLLLRYFEGGQGRWVAEGLDLYQLHSTLNHLFGGSEARQYFYAGIDAVGRFLDEKVAAAVDEAKNKIDAARARRAVKKSDDVIVKR